MKWVRRMLGALLSGAMVLAAQRIPVNEHTARWILPAMGLCLLLLFGGVIACEEILLRRKRSESGDSPDQTEEGDG